MAGEQASAVRQALFDEGLFAGQVVADVEKPVAEVVLADTEELAHEEVLVVEIPVALAVHADEEASAGEKRLAADEGLAG